MYCWWKFNGYSMACDDSSSGEIWSNARRVLLRIITPLASTRKFSMRSKPETATEPCGLCCRILAEPNLSSSTISPFRGFTRHSPAMATFPLTVAMRLEQVGLHLGQSARSLPPPDFLVRRTAFLKDGVGVGTRRTRWAWPRSRRPAEARSRCCLQDAVLLEEGASRDVVRVSGRLGETQDRTRAGIAAFEQGRPFVAGTQVEHFGIARVHFRPLVPIVLDLNLRLGQARAANEFREELRLEGADRDVLAVGGRVGTIEGCTAIQQIAAPLLGPKFAG